MFDDLDWPLNACRAGLSASAELLVFLVDERFMLILLAIFARGNGITNKFSISDASGLCDKADRPPPWTVESSAPLSPARRPSVYDITTRS